MLLSLQPTFTQGLVLGQLSVFFLLALVLKYLFFVSQPPPANHLPTSIPLRPSKQAYLPSEESEAESSEWLNLILRKIVHTYRSELRDNQIGADGDEVARVKVENYINKLRPAGFVDPFIVHSVDLGSSAPRLSNARVRTLERSSDEIEFDMTYSDTISISLSTSVLLNYPLPYFARLPVSLTLSLSVFSSKMSLTLPCPTSPNPTLTFCLSPKFDLDLRISSLVGSRAKLADVPKLHDMIESQIRRTLVDRGTWSVCIPALARSRDTLNTRDDKTATHDIRPGRPLEDIHIHGLAI